MSLRSIAALVTLGVAGWLVIAATADSQDAVPASEEPRHRVKLQNEYVRIIDVEVPAGDATLYHTHSLDYPYVMVTDALLKNDVPGKPTVDLKITRGLIGYYRASQGAYTHRFVNAGSGTFRAIGIELLKPAPSSVQVVSPLADAAGYKTVLDNERVRGYLVSLEPGQSVGPVTLGGPGIRVVLTGGKIEQKGADGKVATLDLAPAQFAWRENTSAQSLTNVGDSKVEIVEFELK